MRTGMSFEYGDVDYDDLVELPTQRKMCHWGGQESMAFCTESADLNIRLFEGMTSTEEWKSRWEKRGKMFQCDEKIKCSI